MRARWVCPNPSPELPIVGQAIVAYWWPGKYYIVSTIQLDSSSPLSRLTRSLETGVAYEEVTPGPDVYVTQVFKCDKNGWTKSIDNLLYEREYPDLTQAISGHNDTVNLLEQGQLKLKRLDRTIKF